MISTEYIARSLQQLEFELRLIRHVLLDGGNIKSRKDFVEAEANRFSQGMQRFLANKPDRDTVDDLLGPAITRSFGDHIAQNINLYVEFSEKRLDQMELILHYAFFESFLLKVIGNILWCYPQLFENVCHQKLMARKRIQKQIAWRRTQLADNPAADQIAKTESLVEAVDHLPFAHPETVAPRSDMLFFWQYVHDGIDLEFGQKEHCNLLELVRQRRNSIVHGNLEHSLLTETLNQARKTMTGFPAILAQEASKRYPLACIDGPQPDGDDGTPYYVHFAKTYH